MEMFGDRIRRLREASGKTQKQIADTLGVSKQTVSNWENNNIMPSMDYFKKLVELYGCSADYLLELGENQFYITTTRLKDDQAQMIIGLVRAFERANEEGSH